MADVRDHGQSLLRRCVLELIVCERQIIRPRFWTNRDLVLLQMRVQATFRSKATGVNSRPPTDKRPLFLALVTGIAAAGFAMLWRWATTFMPVASFWCNLSRLWLRSSQSWSFNAICVAWGGDGARPQSGSSLRAGVSLASGRIGRHAGHACGDWRHRRGIGPALVSAAFGFWFWRKHDQLPTIEP